MNGNQDEDILGMGNTGAGGTGSTTPQTPAAPPQPQGLVAQAGPSIDSKTPTAYLGEVDPSKTVQGLVSQITSKDSDLMQRASQQGMSVASRRGLGNSSVAAQASMGAMLDGVTITNSSVSVAAASTSVAGVIEIATGPEVAAASSTTLAVTPGTIKDSPFTPALLFTFIGQTTNGAVSMAGTTHGGTVSVSRISDARYQVTLPTMADTNYRVFSNVTHATDVIGMCTQVYEKTTAGFKIRVVGTSNNSSDSNNPRVDVAVYGALT